MSEPAPGAHARLAQATRDIQPGTLNATPAILPSSAVNQSADTPAPIPPVRFPCSPEQRRFLILERLEPGNPALMIAARWRLEGAVSGIPIERAFAAIIERHETLRNFIVEENGELVQRIEPKLNFRLAHIDLSNLNETDALAEVARIASLEARIAFDLSQAPLIRAAQLYLRENLSIMLVTAHRLVCDDGSFGILARELVTICALLQAGRKPDPAELPISYGEPAAPQPQRSTEQSLRCDQDFWIRRLHGLKYFELYPDRARPPLQTSNGNVESVMLDHELMRALAQLSSRNGDSVFMMTLAALFTLLHRYSGETDIAIGNQLDGRDEAGLSGVVGVLVNTIVRRADLSGDPTFDELLARLRDVIAESSAYLGIGLDHLIELLKPQRDLSRNPLFSVNFVFRNGIANDEIHDGLRLIDLPADSTGVLCDLNFIVVQQAEGLRLSCEYCTDLFERQTVRQLLHHFGNLLRAAATNPAQKISTITMLDEAERQRLIFDNNRSAVEYPQQISLPQLFETQVERTPDAIALVCGEQSLSYRELDHAANRLSHALRSRGIGRSSRVGICLDRSPDLLVALLAVLKAGAAYVPLDPAYPSSRLAQIVEDAQPAAVLTKLALRERLPVSLGAISRRNADIENSNPAASEPMLILLDAEAAMIGQRPHAALASTAAPDDLAYVIFTSGSTGRPKGVQIQHRALTNLLWAMRKQPGLESTDTLLSVTTVSFDIAALELFLPLIVGAKLVIAQDGESADGSVLLDLLRWHGVSVMQATPVTWQILLAAGWRGDPQLKMLCGGEALTRQLADQLLPYAGAGREPQSPSPQSSIARGGLWNMYGPTETTIWSSALRVEPGTGPVPIGPPIANTQFYVLDPHGQLAPAGAPGELHIGGDGVALGYLNLPEMTRERFVPDPFCDKPHARMYRTGDRVRLRPDASFEFLGRVDHQIKLRGFRIELGEIEAALRADPELADCVALARADASGEMAIEAYVVVQDGPPERAANLVQRLQASLRQSLPAYMCPSFIGVLEALPRTPNGKVDRAALPLPTRSQLQTCEPHLPVSAMERRLAQIWSSVLGIPAMAADANFFEIGGHSLLAVRLLAGIDVEFGRRLSLSALFKNPTIAAQANLLMHGDALAFDFRQVLKLQPNGKRQPLIAINNTGIYYSLSRRLGQDQPFTSLQLFDPALPQASMPQTLEEIAAGYAQLIRRVQPTGPYTLLGWCVAGTLAFEVARQLLASGECVSRLMLFDTWVPGYLRRLPWHKAKLADYSFRWKLVAADWVKAKLGPKRLTTFLANREFVKKLIGWYAPQPKINGSSESPQNSTLSPEQYDQWLLQYLEQAAESYDVKPYPGTVTLFRSSQEPAGRFLDPQMGWGEFANGGVDVVVIDGDHFSIFQEPIVAQLARHVASVVDARPAAGETALRAPSLASSS